MSNSMWDLPRPGIKLVSHALAGRFFTTQSPGKLSLYFFLFLLYYLNVNPMHHVIPSFICQHVLQIDRVCDRQNSKMVPLDSWALLCTYFLLLIQPDTNLGTVLKDFAKVIKILNQLTLK